VTIRLSTASIMQTDSGGEVEPARGDISALLVSVDRFALAEVATGESGGSGASCCGLRRVIPSGVAGAGEISGLEIKVQAEVLQSNALAQRKACARGTGVELK
jgi:hypothetical protein